MGDTAGQTVPETQPPRHPFFVAIIGAGFSGLGLGIRLRQAGIEDFVILEAADRIGGTWRDNVYPGCACDIPSPLYSFSFALSAEWSRAYPPQPEILAYLERRADEHALRSKIRLATRIARARWVEAEALWRLESSQGEVIWARVLVAATGPLRTPAIPTIPGLEDFAGPCMHTARWRPEVDLTEKRVAVIGTGASAIQVIPKIAEIAERVVVVQRTPPWVLPRPDGPIPRWLRAGLRGLPGADRLLRWGVYAAQEAFGLALYASPWLRRALEGLARRHLARQVPDPDLRASLTPSYALGCKRVLISSEYYPALSRPNVELLPSGLARVEAHRVVTASGEAREVDAIVLATGFQVTSFLAPLEVLGRGAVELSRAWSGGARAYLGLAIPRFPNFFLLLGPNTGLGHNSVIIMLEAQAGYVLKCLARMKQEGLRSLEVRAEALRAFGEEMEAHSKRTVWRAGGCTSWYLDEEGRNVTLWPASTLAYRRRTRRPTWSAFIMEPAGS